MSLRPTSDEPDTRVDTVNDTIEPAYKVEERSQKRGRFTSTVIFEEVPIPLPKCFTVDVLCRLKLCIIHELFTRYLYTLCHGSCKKDCLLQSFKNYLIR